MIRLHSEELRSINQGGGKVSRIKIRQESPVTRQVIISPGTKQPRFRSGSNSETFEPKIIFFGRLEEEERRKAVKMPKTRRRESPHSAEATATRNEVQSSESREEEGERRERGEGASGATKRQKCPDLPRPFSTPKKSWISSEKLGWKNWHIRKVNRPIFVNESFIFL